VSVYPAIFVVVEAILAVVEFRCGLVVVVGIVAVGVGAIDGTIAIIVGPVIAGGVAKAKLKVATGTVRVCGVCVAVFIVVDGVVAVGALSFGEYAQANLDALDFVCEFERAEVGRG
jgi:hypothetical protein